MASIIDCSPRGQSNQSKPQEALHGCAANSSSNSGTCITQFPESGAVLAPWVAIEFVDLSFQGNGNIITVGNESSSATNPKNVAVIKSFEFGYSDGVSVRITIHDQQGGAFEKFMHNLLKDWACLKNGGTPATVLMKIVFGWTKSGCSSPLPRAISPCYYIMCDSVETNYTQGIFAFEITGRDQCFRMFEGSSEITVGGQGEKSEHVTDSIKELMTKNVAPTVGKVSFKEALEGGGSKDAEFKAETASEKKKGPRGNWIGNSRNKLEIALSWLSTCPAYDGRNWIPQFNPTEPKGELIFWVNPKRKCEVKDDKYWESNCIGTYIVNGGKFSPVIEFNPKIRWDFSSLTTIGGALSDGKVNALESEGSKNPGLDCKELSREKQAGAGQKMQTVVTPTMRDRFGEKAAKETQISQAEARNTIKITFDNIEADLVIIGNPTICPPFEAIMQKNVSIIVINPFSLFSNGNGSLEWLAQPPCNEVLTNKAWICKSITHRIEAGTFTTTIGVMLMAPGIDLPPNSPFGGWAGGWQPSVTC